MPESLPSNPTRWPGYSNEYEDGRGAIVIFAGLRAMQQSTRSFRTRRSPPIEPALGWTYLSREALARAKAQMDEESMGVRDEIGFLTIHQGYADRFFPGTSVLHTRARYAVFVPWLFEDLAGGRQNKNRHSLGQLIFQLCRTLHVNVEYQVLSGVPCLVELADVGTIIIAENVGIFEEFALGDAGFEIGGGDEEIIFAVHFLASGGPGGVGDGEAKIGHLRQKRQCLALILRCLPRERCVARQQADDGHED